MLQWDWPHVWSHESREAVRVAIEDAIRSAMKQTAQIRGTVIVDLPVLGATPPQLTLSGIRELSVEHTAIMVKLQYDGDCAVTLRGLQINLDTIGPEDGDAADSNFASPFFCPLEMTLYNIRVDGMASIEVFQELERNAHYVASDPVLDPRARGGPLRPQPRCFNSSAVANAQLISSSRSSAPSSQPGGTRGGPPYSSGYGILLGAGGRRAMRLPDALTNPSANGTGYNSLGLGEAGGTSSFGGGGGAPPGAPFSKGIPSLPMPNVSESAGGSGSSTPERPAEPFSIIDIVSKKAVVKRRWIKIQLFGDPVKNFSVKTNFASVQGANSKVEGTIKMLLKPTIDRMMTEGVTIAI